jgi:hypothetical protein
MQLEDRVNTFLADKKFISLHSAIAPANNDESYDAIVTTVVYEEMEI